MRTQLSWIYILNVWPDSILNAKKYNFTVGLSNYPLSIIYSCIYLSIYVAGYEKQNSPHSASFSTSQTITSPSVTPFLPEYQGGHTRLIPIQKDEIFNDDETMMKENSFLVRDRWDS